jgi:hypothetical protein
MATIESTTEIRPFSVEVPEEDLVGLRRRIAATRWAEQETVADQTQGVQLATIRELARYWGSDYEFGRVEARLNAFPRSWAEQAYPNITYFNEADRGGHFAAWEEPELFSNEVRAAFGSLR